MVAVWNCWPPASPRAEERLDELQESAARRRDGRWPTPIKKSDAMTKVLAKASPALAKPLQPKTELEVSKLKQQAVAGRLPRRSGRRASFWA